MSEGNPIDGQITEVDLHAGEQIFGEFLFEKGEQHPSGLPDLRIGTALFSERPLYAPALH